MLISNVTALVNAKSAKSKDLPVPLDPYQRTHEDGFPKYPSQKASKGEQWSSQMVVLGMDTPNITLTNSQSSSGVTGGLPKVMSLTGEVLNAYHSSSSCCSIFSSSWAPSFATDGADEGASGCTSPCDRM
jgi:hypothetical protein